MEQLCGRPEILNPCLLDRYKALRDRQHTQQHPRTWPICISSDLKATKAQVAFLRCHSHTRARMGIQTFSNKQLGDTTGQERKLHLCRSRKWEQSADLRRQIETSPMAPLTLDQINTGPRPPWPVVGIPNIHLNEWNRAVY